MSIALIMAGRGARGSGAGGGRRGNVRSGV